MTIYISIPITGHDIDRQRAMAARIAQAIHALGHETINPFDDIPEADAELSEREKYAYYMGEDISELLLCDAAYFCEGWRKSKGCTLERVVSMLYDIPAYFSLDAIPEAE